MAQLESQYVILIALFTILFSVPVLRLIYRKYIVSAAAAIHDKVRRSPLLYSTTFALAFYLIVSIVPSLIYVSLEQVDVWQRDIQARLSDAGKKFTARLAASSKRLRK
jgi:hypothetical protein